MSLNDILLSATYLGLIVVGAIQFPLSRDYFTPYAQDVDMFDTYDTVLRDIADRLAPSWARRAHSSASVVTVVRRWLPASVLPAAVVLVHGQPPAWCWTWHPSHDDVTRRQSICRRRTACLEQPSSCHPWTVIRHCRCQSSESCWMLITRLFV